MFQKQNVDSHSRIFLSVIYTSFIFGSITSQFYIAAFSLLDAYDSENFFILTAIMTIYIVSSIFLNLILIFESKLELFLKAKLGKIFRPIFILLSFLFNYSIIYGLCGFQTFLSKNIIDTLYVLIRYITISSIISFFIVFFSKKSRLEFYIDSKFSMNNRFHRLYRILAYLILIILLSISLLITHEEYLPCEGYYTERFKMQDYLDCNLQKTRNF